MIRNGCLFVSARAFERASVCVCARVCLCVFSLFISFLEFVCFLVVSHFPPTLRVPLYRVLIQICSIFMFSSRTRKYGVLTENLDSPLGLGDESDEEVRLESD